MAIFNHTCSILWISIAQCSTQLKTEVKQSLKCIIINKNTCCIISFSILMYKQYYLFNDWQLSSFHCVHVGRVCGRSFVCWSGTFQRFYDVAVPRILQVVFMLLCGCVFMSFSFQDLRFRAQIHVQKLQAA